MNLGLFPLATLGVFFLFLNGGCSSPEGARPQALPPKVMAQLSARSTSAAALGFHVENPGPEAVLLGPRTSYHSPSNLVSFPFSSAEGWPIVRARLNGSLEVPLIFDTGASFASLDGRAAAQAGVRLISTNDFPLRPVQGVGGVEYSCIGLLDHLALGALEITNLAVYVRLQETRAGSRRQRVNSLLGLRPAMSGFSYVTIDYSRDLITVSVRDEFRPPTGASRAPLRVPFVLRDGSLRVRLGLPKGHEAEFLVDTGMSGEICLCPATIREAGLEAMVSRGRQVALTGIGGVTLEKQFTLETLEVAGRRYAYLRASSVSWSPFNLIGSGWLRQFRVTIDFRNQVLWLE